MRVVLYVALAAAAGYGLGWWIHGESVRDRLPVGAPTEAPSDGEWQNLLAGEWVERWSNTEDDADIFAIADGELHLYGVSKIKLRYAGLKDAVWRDFDLHLEYKLAPGANSGVFLRWPVGSDAHRGFEVQILDDHGREPSVHRSGAIYDVVAPMFNMSAPAGQWNSFDIRVRGSAVAVVHNGWKVVDTDFSQMTMPIGKFDLPLAEYAQEGFLALQDHGGEVRFRNIYIREARN